MKYHTFKHLQIRERNEFLQDALREHNQNIVHTARALGMPRTALCRLVKQFGLIDGYGTRPPIPGPRPTPAA